MKRLVAPLPGTNVTVLWNACDRCAANAHPSGTQELDLDGVTVSVPARFVVAREGVRGCAICHTG